MNDRVIIQVQFKKALWTCPACAQEDVEDRPVVGGASYEHTCSACSNVFNQSGQNMREYNGCLNYNQREYAELREADISDEKKRRYDEWVVSIKNPPEYIEPTSEQLQQEIDIKQSEISSLTVRRTEQELRGR